MSCTLPGSAASLSRQSDNDSILRGTLQVMGRDGWHRITQVTAGHVTIVASTHVRTASHLPRDLVIVLKGLPHVVAGGGGDTFHLATTPVKRGATCNK